MIAEDAGRPEAEILAILPSDDDSVTAEAIDALLVDEARAGVVGHTSVATVELVTS